jgi:hypothetical protein
MREVHTETALAETNDTSLETTTTWELRGAFVVMYSIDCTKTDAASIRSSHISC